MLFERRFLEGIADGSITLAFRRWRSPRAKEGSVHRTPAGRIRIGSVDIVEPRSITRHDAVRAGYASADELVQDLRGEASWSVFRVSFRLLDEPDHRAELAGSDRLTPDDVVDIEQRLERIDRVSRQGPWTRDVLAAISARPGTRAAELALTFGREVLAFKRDVRMLKEIGLTESLEIGYRLSPRGEAFVRASDDRGEDRSP